MIILRKVAQGAGKDMGEGWNLIVLHHTDCGIKIGYRQAPGLLAEHLGVERANFADTADDGRSLCVRHEAAHGVTREDIVQGRGGPGLRGACAEVRALARRHLAAYEAARPTIAPAARVAFLPTALIGGYLAAMERASYDPLNTDVDLPRWRRLWRLWPGSRAIG